MLVLPKSLRLGQFDYEVSEEVMTEDKWGFHSPTLRKITVHSELSDQMKRDIFIHELFHAMFSVGEIKSEKEEEYVSVLSAQFHSFIKNNPELKEVLFP